MATINIKGSNRLCYVLFKAVPLVHDVWCRTIIVFFFELYLYHAHNVDTDFFTLWCIFTVACFTMHKEEYQKHKRSTKQHARENRFVGGLPHWCTMHWKMVMLHGVQWLVSNEDVKEVIKKRWGCKGPGLDDLLQWTWEHLTLARIALTSTLTEWWMDRRTRNGLCMDESSCCPRGKDLTLPESYLYITLLNKTQTVCTPILNKPFGKSLKLIRGKLLEQCSAKKSLPVRLKRFLLASTAT